MFGSVLNEFTETVPVKRIVKELTIDQIILICLISEELLVEVFA